MAAPVAAQTATQGLPLAPAPAQAEPADRFAIFAPAANPIRHRIDYELWDFALKNLVISMGPSTRQTARPPQQSLGSRMRQGHNSRYRLEGSMLGFSFLDAEAIASFGEYRRELQQVANTLDIAVLPRNEQLAFWFNLHNVAMVEKIAEAWPVRQPRDIRVDGVPLDEAKFLDIRGINMSLKDIRERIVFAHWRDPKVIYGFWRGEIGGPALEREAYTGGNVASLLDVAAEDFINSLRGTQKRSDTLEVATLYADVAPFYFPNFDADLRAHLAVYAKDEVAEILARTDTVRASIEERDIADLAGGSRGANYLASSRPGLTAGVLQLLQLRQRKFEQMERREIPTGRVIFSNIDLPGDPPNKNAVE
ncbi:DUF547 domain-containing protein [Qipengyuania nanhaisediminis]|uniref:DUF547 domain-containing protein n=1 Tax=Qipengyuania nanhaisediminis TaxID=604088 RepID=UPI0038B36190